MFALSALFAAAALALPNPSSVFAASSSDPIGTQYPVSDTDISSFYDSYNAGYAGVWYDPDSNILSFYQHNSSSRPWKLTAKYELSGAKVSSTDILNVLTQDSSLLATGTITKDNTGIVTGGTVWNSVNSEAITRANADTALSNRLGTLANDGGIIGSLPLFHIFFMVMGYFSMR